MLYVFRPSTYVQLSWCYLHDHRA